jgi:D-alanyl-lipoteichoic acid acyltransferase DltB (MBOAT superfamily)
LLFHSLEFALLLALVWPAYLLLRRLKHQNLLILVASYVFYGWWEWRYIPLLLFSTGVDFAVARALSRQTHASRRRLLLATSCIANLGLLGFFKYWGMFASTGNGFAAWLGAGSWLPEFHILLPIGISFYTFQSLAYTVDVYRGTFPAWRSFTEFAAYVSFFPQLIAGPIERPRNLLRAVGAPRQVTLEGIEAGVFLFVQGWLLKTVADALGGVADPVFADPSAHSGWAGLWAAYAFIIQIYCDFFGYSQMARGVARLFGFRLMENFRVPFFASDVRQLWARWHVSLTSWLRDYLYYPLLGKLGRGGQLFSLFMTMAIAGLWHGAAWNFVLWGSVFGLVLVVHAIVWQPGIERRRLFFESRHWLRRGWLTLGALSSFTIFALAGVLFRAQDTASASGLENALTHYAGILRAPREVFEMPPLAMWVVAIALVSDVLQLRAGDSYWSQRWPWLGRGVLIALMVVAAMLLDSPRPKAFIYFQF